MCKRTRTSKRYSGWKPYRPIRRWLGVFSEQDEDDDVFFIYGGDAKETKEAASNSNVR
jgi:hypothetical protein